MSDGGPQEGTGDPAVPARRGERPQLLGLSRIGIGGLVNVASLGLALGLVTGWADADFLLDAFWVTLAIGAFLFSLRTALLRLLLGSLFVIGFSAFGPGGSAAMLDFDPVDLGGFPLLIVISIVVALMAHRVSTTAQRYGALYRQASDRLVTAQEDERERLARDLHDGVGQTLTAVVLTLDAAEVALAGPHPRPSVAQTTVRRAQALAARALDEARQVAVQLRPARIHEVGLGGALYDLTASAGIAIEPRFDPAILPPGLLEPEREIGAYRIVQEAVGNAARHARAQHVWISADVSAGVVTLLVSDDGVGFDESALGRGLGLAGMQERAELLRGHVDVRSTPGVGTAVELTIPYASESPRDELPIGSLVAADVSR